MQTRLFSFDPHHTPPPKTGDPFDVLRLIRSRRVGPATFHRLIAEHGTAAAALVELPSIARAAGVHDYSPCPPGVISAELAAGRRAGARLVTWGGENYPAALYDIPDAPPVLWVRGDARVLDRPLIAVIGARNASSLGLRMARNITRGLGEAGSGIVAGLARGIDTVAHENALETGTIAVMAGGIDVIYPSENAALASSICDTGLLMSEQPPGTAPVARHFPTRNRIISGLSRAVVVVEAACRSGSLITARNALDQGREVMAIPGHPLDARAGGCNTLIRDGATLVRNAADVLRQLGMVEPAPLPESVQAPAPVAVAPTPVGPAIEARILAKLSPYPLDEDSLIRDLGITAAIAAPVILALELDGRVQRVAGGCLTLA